MTLQSRLPEGRCLRCGTNAIGDGEQRSGIEVGLSALFGQRWCWCHCLQWKQRLRCTATATATSGATDAAHVLTASHNACSRHMKLQQRQSTALIRRAGSCSGIITTKVTATATATTRTATTADASAAAATATNIGSTTVAAGDFTG